METWHSKWVSGMVEQTRRQWDNLQLLHGNYVDGGENSNATMDDSGVINKIDICNRYIGGFRYLNSDTGILKEEIN